MEQENISTKNRIVSGTIKAGQMFQRQGKFKDAMEKYKQALQIVEQTGNAEELADVYKNMGSLFHSQGNFKKANENYLKAFSYVETVKDSVLNQYNIGARKYIR